MASTETGTREPSLRRRTVSASTVDPPVITPYPDTASWRQPAIFGWLQQRGNVPDADMWRTFNRGVGMVVCVDAARAEAACALLNENGEHAWPIGEIHSAAGPAQVELVGTAA